MRDDGHRNGGDRDRIDGLISAAMDDALDDASRAELTRLIAEDPAVAERVRGFQQVDQSLRHLAEVSDSEQRLAGNFESLSARLNFSEGSAEASLSPPLGPAETGEVVRLPSRVWPWVAAAAAVAALYLGTTRVAWFESPPAGSSEAPLAAGEISAPISEPGDEGVFEAPAPLSEESLVWALGYVEGPEAEGLAGDWVEDFEVIEQLELLEFMTARDAGVQNEEGRG